MTALPTTLDEINAVIESLTLQRHDLGRNIHELAAKRKLLVLEGNAAAADEIERQGIAAEACHRQLTNDLADLKRHRSTLQAN